MPNPNVTFNGVQIIKPGAYSKIDASELVPSSQGLATVLAIMGDCTGGAPNTPYFFRSGSAAKRVLRSGALLDAIRLAYSPSPDGSTGGADLIVAIRTNPATQSTLALADSNVSPETAVTLTSIDYGVWTTGINVKVEAGTTGKKITIKYVDAELGTILEVYDNLLTRAGAVAAINNGVTLGQGPSQFVTAVASGSHTENLANVAYTPLTSGAEGTTTSTHYTNALTKLELEDVDIVVPLTSDSAITALVKAHVEAMSTAKARKERVAIVGGTPFSSSSSNTATYTTDLGTLAATLSSERVMIVGPDIKVPNASGVTTTYGPEYLAAMVAGLAAAQETGETPTNKLLKLIGLSCQFTQDQIETLLLTGVCPVEFIKSDGFRVVQAITTYQSSASPLHREFSVRRVGDAIMKDLRRTLQQAFVGARGDTTTIQSMLSTVVQRLQRFKSDRVITAFRNVSITVASSIATVSFEFAPVEPINYILITGTAKPGSLSASFSGQDSFTGTVGS